MTPCGIAIHINIDHSGSGLPEFLKVTVGKQKFIIPVLADCGYVSIEGYYKSAIVQQRGSEEETINRNNDIAFERYFGRFKGIWEIMKYGYCGDRRAFPQLICR